MRLSEINDRIAAGLLVLLTLTFGLSEWRVPVPAALVQTLAFLVIVLLVWRVGRTGRIFVAIGVIVSLWLWLSGGELFTTVRAGLSKSAFIAAFFVALSTLRNVAESSPSLRRAGEFLTKQPPGRRYLALTAGGHLFALLINYGSISLLGGLATQSARSEPDAMIARIRTRRMLLAIQRGFISSLTWSPLAFSLAITTVLIPGATWTGAALPGLFSAAIIMLSGWAMDTIFKPRLANPPKRHAVEGNWALLSPLGVLLALLAVTVLGIHLTLGLRVVGIVMIVLPVIAVSWALLQHLWRVPEAEIGARARRYLTVELPGYRGELVLLMMAGYIGTVGAPVLQPLTQALGGHPDLLPPWLVLGLLVWIVPVLGQIGMNPILGVTLLAPLIPAPEALGVTPSAVVVAIVSGWAMSGATSPFTATTLLIGSFAKVSAVHVGLRWNGAYFLCTAALLTIWVQIYAFVL